MSVSCLGDGGIHSRLCLSCPYDTDGDSRLCRCDVLVTVAVTVVCMSYPGGGEV